MPIESYIVYPDTPMAATVSRAALRALLSEGKISEDTLCKRAEDGLLITVGEAVGAAPSAEPPAAAPTADAPAADASAHVRFSFPGARMSAKAPVAEARATGAASKPKIENAQASAFADRPSLEERDFVLAKGLVSPRYVGDLTRTQILRLIRNYKRKHALIGFLRLFIVAAILGGIAWWINENRPDWWGKMADYATRLVNKTGADVDADKVKSHVAQTGKAISDNLKTAKEWVFNGAIYSDKVGIVYDAAGLPSNPAANRTGCGVIAEKDGGVYFFTPLSCLAKAENPSAVLLDGTPVPLSELPMTVFGAEDVAAFYLGRVSDVSAKRKNSEILKVSPLRGVQQTEIRIIAQDDSMVPTLYNKDMNLWRDKAAWRLQYPLDALRMGGAVFERETGALCGLIVADASRIDNRYDTMANLSALSHAKSVDWNTFLWQKRKFAQMERRTQSLERMANCDSSKKAVSDGLLWIAVQEFGGKAKLALGKKTPSLHDTVPVMSRFNERLSEIAKKDTAPDNYTIGFFLSAANAHAAARADYLERIRDGAISAEMLAAEAP